METRPDMTAAYPALPARQSAIAISAAGGPQVLVPREIAVPVPGEGEALIEVAYAGINRHDCNQRRRGPAPGQSDIPGLEVAGIVRAAGARLPAGLVGRRVCALVDGGGYAPFVAAPAGTVLALDAGIPLDHAAGLPEALFTVWHNVVGVAALAPGETVLVHGGTSGVGSIAVQLLSRLGHAVFATCGTDAKCAEALRLGAVAAFNYRTVRFEQEVRRLTAGRGVDIILDMAGAAYGARNVEALARRGRLVHLSPGDGTPLSLPLRELMAREARVTGSLLRPLPPNEKALIAERLRAVAMPLVAAGAVRPLIAGVLPLADAAEGHARLESGEVSGKLLLRAATAERITEMETA